MPVIIIQALPQAEGTDIPQVLSTLCLEVASALDLPPRGVWATWHTLEANHYVEADQPAAIQPANTHPPIVRFISFGDKTDAQIAAALEVTAKVLAESLSLEAGNVFILYDKAQPGRVYTGGQVRR